MIQMTGVVLPLVLLRLLLLLLLLLQEHAPQVK
jgi:hypothetical protein